MKTVDIKVFKIAQTRINKDETRNWLDHLGANNTPVPKEEEVTDAGAVCGLCAKRCYLSFESGINPNINRVRKKWDTYLKNILKSGHGCYDAETEVLTAGGWKNWSDVTEEDQFATLDLLTNNIAYERPTRLIKYTHRGSMYRVTGKVNLLVTPDHKMVSCPTTTREGRKKSSFKLLSAAELASSSYACKKDGIWATPPTVVEEDYLDYLWLLGFYIGDGSFRSGTSIDFHLKKQRKIGKLLKLFPKTSKRPSDKFTVKVPSKYWGMFEKSKGKHIPQELLLNCSNSQLEALYQGLIDSDGSARGNSIVFDTVDQKLAGQFQQLLLHTGRAGNISQATCCTKRETSFGEKPIFRINVTSYITPEVNKKATVSKTLSHWIHNWEGEVFCAEVPNNTLYVRRGGSPVWSGNSVLEHATWTWAIEGVSRVFTGEMNRHRAGVAISEGSMRYIRFDDMPFWMPISLSPGNQILKHAGLTDGEFEEKKLLTRELFKNSFQQMEDGYQELCALWEIENLKAFGVKKKLTSLFRRIAGMGVATGGTWTMNGRALRHIMALRTTEHAEEEIAYVMGMLAKRMCEEEPALFGDFEEDSATGVWVPKHPKV